MLRISLALILALLPVLALAQGDAPQPAETPSAAAPAYRDYAAGSFGFAVQLPATGTIEDPSTAGWSEDPEVAFDWYYGGDEPIVLIQGRVDKFEVPLDDETFKLFCDTLLKNWAGDTGTPVVESQTNTHSTVTPQGDVDSHSTTTSKLAIESGKYKVLTANEPLDINGQKWNLIEVADSSDPQGTKVYYSVFSTYSGNQIYTISMYYLEPVSDKVQQFGFPVLDGFKLVTK